MRSWSARTMAAIGGIIAALASSNLGRPQRRRRATRPAAYAARGGRCDSAATSLFGGKWQGARRHRLAAPVIAVIDNGRAAARLLRRDQVHRHRPGGCRSRPARRSPPSRKRRRHLAARLIARRAAGGPACCLGPGRAATLWTWRALVAAGLATPRRPTRYDCDWLCGDRAAVPDSTSGRKQADRLAAAPAPREELALVAASLRVLQLPADGRPRRPAPWGLQVELDDRSRGHDAPTWPPGCVTAVRCPSPAGRSVGHARPDPHGSCSRPVWSTGSRVPHRLAVPAEASPGPSPRSSWSTARRSSGSWETPPEECRGGARRAPCDEPPMRPARLPPPTAPCPATVSACTPATGAGAGRRWCCCTGSPPTPASGTGSRPGSPGPGCGWWPSTSAATAPRAARVGLRLAATLGRDLSRRAAALEIERPVLAGHSWGRTSPCRVAADRRAPGWPGPGRRRPLGWGGRAGARPWTRPAAAWPRPGSRCR